MSSSCAQERTQKPPVDDVDKKNETLPQLSKFLQNTKNFKNFWTL